MPLLLASKSRARREMLQAAGLEFEIVPAALDEEGLVSEGMRRGDAPEVVCAELARRKALAASTARPDATVIGADQMLYDDRAIRFKSSDAEIAVATLMAMQGRTHVLLSSVCVAEEGVVVWEAQSLAKMSMRPFDEAFARRYVARVGDVATQCVGGYEIEGLGVWLFDDVQGDGFTIRGLPLVALVQYLSKRGMGPL